MLKKTIPQHKRMAQGGGHVALGYARGGSVPKSTIGSVKVSAVQNPLTTARHNNGIPGMKTGGKVGKKC